MFHRVRIWRKNTFQLTDVFTVELSEKKKKASNYIFMNTDYFVGNILLLGFSKHYDV